MNAPEGWDWRGSSEENGSEDTDAATPPTPSTGPPPPAPPVGPTVAPGSPGQGPIPTHAPAQGSPTPGWGAPTPPVTPGEATPPTALPPTALPPSAVPPSSPPPAADDPDAAALAQIWAEAREPAGHQPKQFRTRRGPHVSGRGVFGVFGLLALLLTVAVLGLLGWRVLSDLEETDTVRSAEPERNGGEGSAGAGMDMARQAACETDRATLRTAISAYRAMTGEAPPDQEALVAAVILDAPVETFAMEVEGEDVVLRGVGECEGV